MTTTVRPTYTYSDVSFAASWQLIEILRVFAFTHSAWGDALLRVHLLANISWDDLRGAICPLRATVGQDREPLQALFFFTSDLALRPHSNFDSTISAIAWGGLRMLKRIFSREIPPYHLSVVYPAVSELALMTVCITA
jgi:hypothetical protein